MRNTGLRLGELCALEFNCIRSDEEGNHFLKVPLGKLNSERLVPLDEPTMALVRELQQGGQPLRTWLLETKRGKRARHCHFTGALEAAVDGLEIPNGMRRRRAASTSSSPFACTSAA